MSKFAILTSLCVALPLVASAQIYRPLPGNAAFVGRSSESRVYLPYYTFLADINHDGNLDMVITGPAPESLFVMWGDGEGHFTQGPVSEIVPGSEGYTRLADINGDGILDYVFADGHNEFNIAYGNSDGTFQPAVTYPLSFPKSQNQSQVYSFNVVPADFNGDGKLDIAVAGESGWEVLLNTGSGFQLSAQVLAVYGNQYTGLAVGDINGDGIPDLVYSSLFSVQSYLGKGNGTFGPGTPVKLPNAVQNRWNEVELADWNGDGKLDLLVGNANFSTFYRLAGNGDGTFQTAIGIKPPYSCGEFSVADFNNDGIADIACFGSAVLVYSGLGGGEFGSPASYATDYSAGAAEFAGASIGSLRNNGKLDIVVPVSDGANLLFNTGSGFEETPSISAPGSAAFASADLNGDGITDLVTVGSEGFEVFWGTGKASKPFVAGPVSSSGNLRAAYLTLGDFNGDGLIDVAVTVGTLSAPTSQVAVCFGDGKGHFGAPIYSATSYGSHWLAAADLNGDGKVDIVTSGISVQFGNGDGSFQPPGALGSPTVSNIVIADLNGDGKPDIFTTTSTPYPNPGIEVFLNQGNGLFASPLFVGGYQDTFVAECDVNGDGIPDILATSGGSYPEVLLGTGNGGFVQVPNSSTSFFTSTAFACGTFTRTQSLPEVAMISNYYSSMVVETDPGGTGVYTQNENTWGAGAAPLGVISGKFHGPNAVDDLVVLNDDGTISYFINETVQ